MMRQRNGAQRRLPTVGSADLQADPDEGVADGPNRFRDRPIDQVAHTTKDKRHVRHLTAVSINYRRVELNGNGFHIRET
jgi:hypothetical protein